MTLLFAGALVFSARNSMKQVVDDFGIFVPQSFQNIGVFEFPNTVVVQHVSSLLDQAKIGHRGDGDFGEIGLDVESSKSSKALKILRGDPMLRRINALTHVITYKGAQWHRLKEAGRGAEDALIRKSFLRFNEKGRPPTLEAYRSISSRYLAKPYEVKTFYAVCFSKPIAFSTRFGKRVTQILFVTLNGQAEMIEDVKPDPKSLNWLDH